MKLLLALMLLAAPAAAAEHYPTPHRASVSAEMLLNDTVNQGAILSYGYPEEIGNYDIEVQQRRMIVPHGVQHYFRHPYNQFVTVY